MAEDTDIKEVTTTENTTEKKEEEKIKCPCCGETTLVKPLDIPSPVLDEYLASMMSGVSFSHTYPLYGGKLEITATSLDRQTFRRFLSINQLLLDLKRSIAETDVRKETIIEDIQAVFNVYPAITAINTYADKKLVKTFEPAAKMDELCSAILDNQKYIYNYMKPEYEAEDKEIIFDKLKELYTQYCSESVLSAVPQRMLQGVVATHSDLNKILLESGFDENFWHGIELA